MRLDVIETDVPVDVFDRECARLRGRLAAMSDEQLSGIYGEFAELLSRRPTRREILEWYENRTACARGATACQATLDELVTV